MLLADNMEHDAATSAIDAERWQAVATRDSAADGEFVFAVKSTGVFCRPGCSSRLPLRKNVVFFDTVAAAAAAGFRACKRCRPTRGAGRRFRRRHRRCLPADRRE